MKTTFLTKKETVLATVLQWEKSARFQGRHVPTTRKNDRDSGKRKEVYKSVMRSIKVTSPSNDFCNDWLGCNIFQTHLSPFNPTNSGKV